jgi:signal transduction histidine kinase
MTRPPRSDGGGDAKFRASLGTHLLLPLVATVTLVMSAYGFWAAGQRRQALEAQAYREAQAYATALGIALEYAFDDRQLRDVGDIVDRISREPKIYGVAVYGLRGELLYVASPLQARDVGMTAALRRVLAGARDVVTTRRVEGERAYSVYRPIRSHGSIVGAFEVVQPLSFVERELTNTRRRLLIGVAVLLTSIAVVMLALVRMTVARPLNRFVGAVQALGRGELAHRLNTRQGSSELAEVARQFNLMADRLESARSELVRETEERVALERRVRESEKMAAVGSLSAALAHEIGAPLSVVAGRAEMLLKDERENERKRRALQIIVDQIGRITMIVRNLLNYARQHDRAVRDVRVDAQVARVLDLLEHEFARSGVEVATDTEPVTVAGDPELLQQVFFNLLVNAVQALETQEPPRLLAVRTRVRDGSAVIEFEDNGPGVADDVAEKVFEPFVTTKGIGQGTGLGLAVARRIIDEHGGTIELSAGAARNGGRSHGACFRVTLPLKAV